LEGTQIEGESARARETEREKSFFFAVCVTFFSP
jgi:hypothetical protein